MAEILDELASFLIEAKRRAYAGLNVNATVSQPLLRGSKQLEHRDGPFAYRDIYFGMAFFVGQETVSKNGRAIWSMSYGGGVRPEVVDRAQVLSTYEFLRQALLAVNRNLPYRGPASFSIGDKSISTEFRARSIAFMGQRKSRSAVQCYTSCTTAAGCCDRPALIGGYGSQVCPSTAVRSYSFEPPMACRTRLRQGTHSSCRKQLFQSEHHYPTL